jgi:hypothetical protein
MTQNQSSLIAAKIVLENPSISKTTVASCHLSCRRVK